MKDINYLILEYIIYNTLRVSEKYKEHLTRLKGLGYIEYVEGEWKPTKEGIDAYYMWTSGDIK